MLCTRCGNQLANTTTVCPVCGALNTPSQQGDTKQATRYGNYPEQSFGAPASYTLEQEQPIYPDYRQPQMYYPEVQPPPFAYSPASVTGQPRYEANRNYQPPISHTAPKNDTILVTEVILSLFGIFGVGWLMAGETVTGIVLLICSALIYWPIMIFGTVFTFGFGLICLAPFAIGAIILNILLLNGTLRRKAARSATMPPPHMYQRR
jgi:TM2 domain-containing membrane protein YozV